MEYAVRVILLDARSLTDWPSGTQPLSTGQKALDGKNAPGTGPRFLIADDHAMFGETLRVYLEKTPWQGWRKMVTLWCRMPCDSART
jgi:hypothetical protein